MVSWFLNIRCDVEDPKGELWWVMLRLMRVNSAARAEDKNH